MFKDAFIYLLSKLIPAALGIGILFIYLTSMPPEVYGVYSLSLITLGLFNVLTTQWIRSSMLRFYNDKVENFMGKIFYFVIIVTIINVIIVGLLVWYTKFSFVTFIIATVLITNIIYFEVMNNYYRTIILPKKVLIANILKNLSLVIILLLFVNFFSELTLDSALLIYSISLLISNIYYFLNFKEIVYIEYDRKLLKPFLDYGIPLSLSFALGIILQNIDKYFITIILGTEYNGYYSLAYDFIHNSLYMIMGSLSMASLPRILKSNRENFNSDFLKYINYFYAISFPFLVISISISTEIVTILNRYGYELSIFVVVMITIATFIQGVNSFVYNQAVQLLKQTSIIIVPVLVAVIVTVIINVTLLGKVGIVAAAVSSVVAFSTSNYLIIVKLRKIDSIRVMPKNILIHLVLATIMTAVLFNLFIINIFMTVLIKVILTIMGYIFYYYIFKKSIRRI
ncbi:oligosaccharide flippase family protein [Phocicoccus pinnipedialis]|uniref:Uncharacterized protein n=1 Tax=Phocicoccus pinnipedialis TaxID=110845 RepID=A0A6V7RLV4_9BACL|nr:oligosaccharide flippase family protein [Jeotgalicoccus pinnipedialis]MBP1938808.1 O-antigen/teichoic acid export membrane protein [Jeotgalicoccus pinnipedialis]CAD2079240.1 hypothetical protein JEOPIN946_01536 [Jeotgalicoccus pinnipedialis]